VGVIVLGPPQLTTEKLLYVGGLLVATVAAVESVVGQRLVLPTEVRRLIVLSAVGTVLLGIPATFRLASGTDPASVFRDLAPYVLLAVAPVFAIDVAVRLSLDRLNLIAAIGLALGSVAFLLSWSIRRAILVDQSGTTIFRWVLHACGPPPTVRRMSLRRPVAQATVLVALMGLAAATVIVTGTRSFLLEIPAVLAAVAISGATASSRIRRVILVTAMAVITGLLVTFVIVAVIGFDMQSIAGRWSLLMSAIGDPAGDASLAGRAAQTETAWRLFLSSPIFGVANGLGGVTAGGDIAGDTPIALLASFGLVGLAAVVALMLGWIGLVLRRPLGAKWPRATMIGMLLAAVTFSFILPIVQDKGLGFRIPSRGCPCDPDATRIRRGWRAASAGGPDLHS